MTEQPVDLEQLEIIGYAEVLPDGKGPAVVPPVFRDRTDFSRCFVPPFRISGRWLLDPQLVSFAEVQELEKSGRLTLPAGFQRPARRDCLLWVGLDGTVNYESATDARRKLRNLYREHLDAATAALRKGDIEAAERQAGTALAADDQAVEPDALIAACHALRGEEKHVAFMQQEAEAAGHSSETFGLLLKNYVEMVPPNVWDSLSFEVTASACRQAGVDVGRRFELPIELSPYVDPVLRNALLSHTATSVQILCSGSDVSFLSEFVRLFKHNLIPKLTGGQAVEVVRKAFWGSRARRCRFASWPAESVEGYFLRMCEVLVETGVIWLAVEDRNAASQRESGTRSAASTTNRRSGSTC
jgi:hypothetical protein